MGRLWCFQLCLTKGDESAVSPKSERSGPTQHEIRVSLPDSPVIYNKEPALPPSGSIGSRDLNCKLWAFSQGEEVPIPGKTFLLNAVIMLVHVFERDTSRGALRAGPSWILSGNSEWQEKEQWPACS